MSPIIPDFSISLYAHANMKYLCFGLTLLSPNSIWFHGISSCLRDAYQLNEKANERKKVRNIDIYLHKLPAQKMVKFGIFRSFEG